MLYYYYHHASENSRNVQRPQHRVYVQATTIGAKRGQSQATKVVCPELVEEIGDLFRQVASHQLLLGGFVQHQNCQVHAQLIRLYW